MAKIIDITDKLTYGENPRLVIRGEELEVHSDAKTVLEIMSVFKSGDDVDAALKAYEKLFSESDRSKIDAMKLQFDDLITVIGAAMELIKGDGDDQGER